MQGESYMKPPLLENELHRPGFLSYIHIEVYVGK